MLFALSKNDRALSVQGCQLIARRSHKPKIFNKRNFISIVSCFCQDNVLVLAMDSRQQITKTETQSAQDIIHNLNSIIVRNAIFKEDKSPISHFQAVTNLSILLTIAINLFRFLGFRSITNGLSLALWQALGDCPTPRMKQPCCFPRLQTPHL